MSSKARQTQVQVQKLTPQQILQANIMQLTNTLLEQRIMKELEDNPTLEIIDEEPDEEEEIESDSESSEEADVIILNSCVVRQSAENKVTGTLGSLKAHKRIFPEKIVALMGCMVGPKTDEQAANLLGTWSEK